ncbi:hypothetical protein MHAS44199_20390 [Mycolicibacterium hassiacum DSM 44199]|nr:hypothetical protein [Mycolicibacterium hassiacum DSM 44199]
MREPAALGAGGELLAVGLYALFDLLGVVEPALLAGEFGPTGQFPDCRTDLADAVSLS